MRVLDEHPGQRQAQPLLQGSPLALAQGLAEEVREEQIWVNAVVPSILDTPLNRRSFPDADHARWPDLPDVAQTIAFLASPQNRSTRGALVPVFGRS